MKHRRALVPALVASLLVLAACATPPPGEDDIGAAADAPPGASLGSLAPGLPDGDVVGQGTVMDTGGEVELCLGPVLESYPPQCSGIPLEGWSWDGLDDSESEGDKRWGTYAVQGTYDGETLTLTQPAVPLALYDPPAQETPFDGEPGTIDKETLLEIQDTVVERLGAAMIAYGPADGRLWIQVAWDDGTWQRAADDDFGDGVVIVESLLRAP